jgi:hypothetical protein
MSSKRRVPPDKIQVCLTREDRWRLNQLHKRTGHSRGELFRRGLKAYELAEQLAEAEGEIESGKRAAGGQR